MWVRIDNRLVHGQVIETWIPYVDAKTLIVVNDALAKDVLQQEIISLAVPEGLTLLFLSLEQLKKIQTGLQDGVLILFANCQDAKIAFENGLKFQVLNIGNLHYTEHKVQICEHVALSPEELQCLRYLQGQGVELDFRCVPHKHIQVEL